MSTTATPTAHPRQATRVLFMGPPGAGKREQGVALAQRLQIPALSTGDLFRAALSQDTPLAAQLRDVVAYGGYVDDDTTNTLMDRRLSAPDCSSGFLLFGYPKTLGQAHHLDDLLRRQETRLDAVLSFELGEDELVTRLLARGQDQGRVEDQADLIRRRLTLFHERTEPLIDQYRKRGLLATVDATGTPNEVAERVDQALSGLPGPLAPAQLPQRSN
jgi:adenylate kinase